MMVNNQPYSVMMMPLENRREAIIELGRIAEEMNYEALFLPETWTFDTTVLLAELAVRTQNIKLGTGILSVWGRSAATISMAAATLNLISDGRFILGLGASTKQLVEGFHDVEFNSPNARLRQVITQVRAITNGDRIPLRVVPEARPLKLNLDGFGDIPIILGASSQHSIALAGELCDGWLPFLYPKNKIKDGIALLTESVRMAEVPEKDFMVCPIIPTIVGEDTASAREGAAWVVSFYIRLMGPIYRNVLIQSGFKTEVSSIMQANENQHHGIVPSDSEILLDQLCLYGTPQEVREKIPAWYKAGATMPCFMFNPNLSLEQINFSVKAIRFDGN